LPASVDELRAQLLGGYTCPVYPPTDELDVQKTLTISERMSLKHYIAWKQSRGTVLAYSLHAKVLQEAVPDVQILSLHNVRKLSTRVTGLQPILVDICPKNCVAYTGEFSELKMCPYIRDGKTCNQPRYKMKKSPTAKDRPRAQMMCLPVIATIKALFANEDTAQQMRHRDKCLQEALHILASASGADKRKYSDFGNSSVHLHHVSEMNLFKNPCDVAVAISTDGAQLTMKKQSDTWILLILLFNLPPEVRYLATSTIIALATPGPNPPGHLESFV
ncbi:hypothetical protein BV25DRAFT_1770439, partial [Artomyces pyxidatus]